MKSTTLFLKQDTHCTDKKSDSALLSKKNAVFFKENTLLSINKPLFFVKNTFSYIHKKAVLNLIHCIKLYTIYTIFSIQYKQKTTLSKKIFLGGIL